MSHRKMSLRMELGMKYESEKIILNTTNTLAIYTKNVVETLWPILLKRLCKTIMSNLKIPMKKYEPHVIELANELAERLDDFESLNAYLQYADKYKEDFILRVLDKVMSIPDEKIKKTRGALFTYLISNHGAREHFRDFS